MRLLVDENLSVRVARQLAGQGHDALHVTDVGLANTDDEVILQAAGADDRVIVTADSDFSAMLATTEAAGPSVVMLRSSDHLTPTEQADLIGRVADLVGDDLSAGAIASVTPERVRVRTLPVTPD